MIGVWAINKGNDMKALKRVIRKKIKKMQKLGKPVDEMYQCLRRVHNYNMFRIGYKHSTRF